MKNVKVLGKANDKIPRDEILLAKMLQNVGVYNLKWCEGYYFLDQHNNPLHCELYLSNKIDLKFWLNHGLAAACAFGAAHLSPDSGKSIKAGRYFYADTGNDNTGTWRDLPGEDLGWAYRQAMTIKE